MNIKKEKIEVVRVPATDYERGYLEIIAHGTNPASSVQPGPYMRTVGYEDDTVEGLARTCSATRRNHVAEMRRTAQVPGRVKR